MNGLLRVSWDEQRPPEEFPVIRVKGHSLRGTPRRYDKLLLLAERTSGNVTVLDLTDPEQPGLLEHFNLPGNPAAVLLRHRAMVIPNGYEGLWVESR